MTISPSGVAAFALLPDGGLWAAGEYFVTMVDAAGAKTEYIAFDHPNFLDRFSSVVLDGQGQPWFAGRKRVLTFDGEAWMAYAYDGASARLHAGAKAAAGSVIGVGHPRLSVECEDALPPGEPGLPLPIQNDA